MSKYATRRFSCFQTRSKLVRASLKRSLEMKRKNSSGGDSSEAETMKLAKLEYNDTTDDDCDDDTDSKSTRCGVSPVRSMPPPICCSFPPLFTL